MEEKTTINNNSPEILITPAENKPVLSSKNKLRRIIFLILFIIIFSIIFLILAYLFFAIPTQVKGDPIFPYSNNQTVFGEKISYLFRKPQIGDIVTYSSKNNEGVSFIGIILSQNDNEYQILRGHTTLDIVSQNQISERIYFPPIKKEVIDQILKDSVQLLVSPIPSPVLPTPQPTIYNQIKPSPSLQIISSPKPSIQPTASPNPTPTPSPTPRTPNPPIINISYPAEMQIITFTSPSQKLCVVDVPAGGNTEGIRRKHSINDASWTEYIDMFTLCFDPKEGLNRFQLQYQNKYGDESTQYTRQFTFQKGY